MPRNILSFHTGSALESLLPVQISHRGLLIALPTLGVATTPRGLMYCSRVSWTVGTRTRLPDIKNEAGAL